MTDKTVIGLDDLLRKFDDVVVEPAHMRNLLLAMAAVIEAAIKEKIKERGLIESGRLRSSVGSVAKDDYNVFVGVFNLVYAAIHEFGGVIKAKTGKYLHFKSKDEQWHRVEQVVMPARPYVRPAFNESRDEAIQTFNDLLVEHYERVARS